MKSNVRHDFILAKQKILKHVDGLGKAIQELESLEVKVKKLGPTGKQKAGGRKVRKPTVILAQKTILASLVAKRGKLSREQFYTAAERQGYPRAVVGCLFQPGKGWFRIRGENVVLTALGRTHIGKKTHPSLLKTRKA